MSDISSITLPNGSTYNIKDTTARNTLANKPDKDSVELPYVHIGSNAANSKGWYKFGECMTNIGVDAFVTLLITDCYGTGGGLVQIRQRTNNADASNMTVWARWLVRYGIAAGDIIMVKDASDAKKYHYYIKLSQTHYGFINIRQVNNSSRLESPGAFKLVTSTAPTTGLTATYKSIDGANTASSTFTYGLNTFLSRPASANTYTYGDGRIRYLLATTSMTEGKPDHDANMLDFQWDNTGGYNAQLALWNGDTPRIQIRSQNAGTWSSWATVLDSGNYKDYKHTLADITDFRYYEPPGSATTFTKGVPYVKADGVMEVGCVLDFHRAGSNKDYDVRITANTDGISISGNTRGKFIGDLTGNLVGSERKITNDLYNHQCSSSSGTAGYFKFATAVIGATYQNAYITFNYNARSKQGEVYLAFANSSMKDPTIQYFYQKGKYTNDIYAVKSATSTWDFYIRKAEPYDSCRFYDLHNKNAGITWTWSDTTVTALPTGYQTATVFDDTADTTYSPATQSANGLMTAADKKKLDGIAESADNVTVTQTNTEGVEIASVTVNGTKTKIIAPSPINIEGIGLRQEYQIANSAESLCLDLDQAKKYGVDSLVEEESLPLVSGIISSISSGSQLGQNIYINIYFKYKRQNDTYNSATDTYGAPITVIENVHCKLIAERSYANQDPGAWVFLGECNDTSLVEVTITHTGYIRAVLNSREFWRSPSTGLPIFNSEITNMTEVSGASPTATTNDLYYPEGYPYRCGILCDWYDNAYFTAESRLDFYPYSEAYAICQLAPQVIRSEDLHYWYVYLDSMPSDGKTTRYLPGRLECTI